LRKAAPPLTPRVRCALGQVCSFTCEDVTHLLGHSAIVLTTNAYPHVLGQRQVALVMDAVLGG
jgi:hypothetical protein